VLCIVLTSDACRRRSDRPVIDNVDQVALSQ